MQRKIPPGNEIRAAQGDELVWDHATAIEPRPFPGNEVGHGVHQNVAVRQAIHGRRQRLPRGRVAKDPRPFRVLQPSREDFRRAGRMRIDHERERAGIRFHRPSVRRRVLRHRDMILHDLTQLAEPGTVQSQIEARRAFETDALTAYRCMPFAVLLPRTTEEVSRLLP